MKQNPEKISRFHLGLLSSVLRPAALCIADLFFLWKTIDYIIHPTAGTKQKLFLKQGMNSHIHLIKRDPAISPYAEEKDGERQKSKSDGLSQVRYVMGVVRQLPREKHLNPGLEQ